MTDAPGRPGRKYLRPCPANFVEIAKGRSINHVRRLTGAHHETVKRWFLKHGMTSAGDMSRFKQLPEGFAEKAATMSNRALAAEFGLCMKVVARLRGECGVAYERPKPKAKTTRLFIRGPKPAPQSQRDDTVAGRAADHMRRERWIVTRCNAAKMFDPKGDHYRVGSLFLTAEELVGMAERKGFVAFPERMAA